MPEILESWVWFVLTQSFPTDYRHAGCTCAPEFYGPHCEFLKINTLNEAEVEEPSPSAKIVQKDGSSHVALLLPLWLFCTALLVIAAFVYRRHRKERGEKFNPPVTQIDNLSPRKYDDGDNSFHRHRMLSKDKEPAYSDLSKEEGIPFGDDSLTLRDDIDRMFLESRAFRMG